MKSFKFAGAALALGLMSCAALAQTATVPGPNSIDLTPVFNTVIMGVGTILAALLTALGGFAISWFRAKTGLLNKQTADAAQQIFSEQIARMMAYGEAFAKSHEPKDGVIDVDNVFFRKAIEFGVEKFPETIGKLDYDAIARSIIARIPTGGFTATADAITVAKAAAPAAVK